jgi:thiol-disulfide isomerase/thioredoxin
MKRIYFLVIFLVFFFSGYTTITAFAQLSKETSGTMSPGRDTIPQALNFSEQSTWILGYFKRNRLTSSPYSTWFLKGYDDYQMNSDAINKLIEIGTAGITIKIVMGTWCPDSRRETPRFMRILDAWHFPDDRVTFIGVDDLKQSPVGEYSKLDIHRVPTFIFYKNNIEAGRIIENPSTSLEQDMVNILSRNE